MDGAVREMNELEEEADCVLSDHTLAALQEFYTEQNILQYQEKNSLLMPQEDWNLSQFWYSEETISLLAKEIFGIIGSTGKVVCISCPSLFIRLQNDKQLDHVVLLEYDIRFDRYSQFHRYDFNDPLNLASNLANDFDIVVADPPFLNEECLQMFSQTINYLRKPEAKIILCTGSVQSDLASKLLGLKECLHFKPKHEKNLSNDFSCYVNYESVLLK